MVLWYCEIHPIICYEWLEKKECYNFEGFFLLPHICDKVFSFCSMKNVILEAFLY